MRGRPLQPHFARDQPAAPLSYDAQPPPWSSGGHRPLAHRHKPSPPTPPPSHEDVSMKHSGSRPRYCDIGFFVCVSTQLTFTRRQDGHFYYKPRVAEMRMAAMYRALYAATRQARRQPGWGDRPAKTTQAAHRAWLSGWRIQMFAVEPRLELCTTVGHDGGGLGIILRSEYTSFARECFCLRLRVQCFSLVRACMPGVAQSCCKTAVPF